MGGTEGELFEAQVRDACEHGRYEDAATLLVTSYGPELLGFLGGWMGDREAAREAFSMCCEDLWLGLPGVEWRCTVRGWAYTLARNAGRRHAKAEQRDRGRKTSLTSSKVSLAAADVMSTVDPYLRTDFKDRFQELRERLPPEDRLLLLLRSGRGLSFRDIVFVSVESPPQLQLSEEAVTREAARLRKRFQVVKGKLRDLARAEGLVP